MNEKIYILNLDVPKLSVYYQETSSQVATQTKKLELLFFICFYNSFFSDFSREVSDSVLYYTIYM